MESSSFISTQNNASRAEVEEIRQLLHIPNIPLPPSIYWPPIGISPINEYNTKDLLSMYFPTLFPTGAAMLKLPPIHEVDMHKYALHLIHYHDNRFGQHPHFRYYIYNLIMCHRSNATASIFVKINLEDTLPPTILDLLNNCKTSLVRKLVSRSQGLGFHYMEHTHIRTKLELN